ncbi:MAG TPA: molybdopterin cofactor-binding domain-containing protein [Anaerolineae bacterium]|nr:molybdopterin cofactor-binding domain-containing protein [Anaerolineae bacterium]
MPILNFTLNNKPVSVEAQPNESLAEVLRYRLGMTGTKIGCNEAECGICTVIVDGQPIDSCIYPALKADGAAIETIEGLANGHLHPLQENFIKFGAVQCGFCTPGLIMQSKALLDRKAGEQVSEEEIKIALKDTYCRCTGYVSVLKAIKAANGQNVSVEDYLPETKHGYNVVGEALPRADSIAKVTGAAIYTDDVSFPGMLFGATLRAMIPHALIKKIDTRKAKALPGVHAVLTHEDVPGNKNHGLVTLDWPVLCYDKVRYVGDAVAIVAADSIEIAKAALQLIDVEYEPLPIVATAEYAHQADSPLVHDSGNLLKHIKVAKGDVDQGFAEADVVIERTYHTACTEHAFLEPECSIGRITDDGRYEIYVGSQIVYQDRDQVAAVLGIAEDQVRIISTLIGGGFGGKEDIAGQIHVALLAKATRRPVKMLYTRHESLIFHPKRHATTITVKLGAKKDGRLTAAKAELYGDTGAYASLGEKVLTRATTHANGPYAVANAKSDCFAMYTNNVPAGAFRGFGVTQSAYAVEMTIDELAEQLQIDPIEIRKMNALKVGSTTNTGQVLRESVGLIECIEKVVDEINRTTAPSTSSSSHFVRSESALDASLPANKKRAWGIAVGYKNTGLGGGANDCAGAEIEVYPSGISEIRTSSAEIGQGLPGVLAAIVAEELGLPIEKVNVLLSDTDRTPNGGPTTASRQTFVSGNAARHAAIQMRANMSSVAAERLDVSPDSLIFRNSRVEHNGKSASFAEVVEWMQAEGRSTKLTYEYTAPTTQPLGTGGDMHFAFSYAAHAALVEVDTDTGEVKVLKVIAAHDIGRAINPLALEGQIDGGIVMGIGNALTEEFPHEKGIPYVQWLARYKMPSIKHTPEIKSFIVEHEASTGPFGAKGVGEISSIPITPAITNAIYNAVGVRVRRLPVDQDTLLRAMKSVANSVD